MGTIVYTCPLMKRKKEAPGKHYRKGMSLIEAMRMFPDDAASEAWFTRIRWSGRPTCPHCHSDNEQSGAKHKTMPYRCRTCRKRFSLKSGTVMEASNLGYQIWAVALYLLLTGLKGVSSMKLHRDLSITQKTAWHLAHRLRTAFIEAGPRVVFDGPVEVDETFVGGLRKNMPKHKRKMLTGRGTEGKIAVVGLKDRETKKVAARVVSSTDGETLQEFVREHVEPGAEVFTDDARVHRGLTEYEHGTVRHSVGEYVDGHIHTNGIESLWSMLKRAHKGVYHKLSPKHLERYVDEFGGRQNIRELDMLDRMTVVAAWLVGKRLKYRDLIKPNGLPSGARSG